MKEGIIKDTFELVLKELQTVISVAYLTIVGIGMLFYNHKYAEFGINIFDYADIFDFLIAPFSDIYIFLFATVSMLFLYILFTLDALLQKKRPKLYSRLIFGRDKKPWYKTYRRILIAISITIYLVLSADYYGRYAKEQVIEQEGVTIVFTSEKTMTGKLIGKTNDVLFLLKGEKVSALPIGSSVKEIQLK